MTKRTAFLQDELCFWHSSGLEYVQTRPAGGWVQVLTRAGFYDSPESKRRIKALMDVSGLTAKLDHRSATPATQEELLRVHDVSYLTRFKELSDASGGQLGIASPFGPGSFEIACLSAGLARQAVDDVLTGHNENAYALCRPCGHHALPDRAGGGALLANIAIAIEAAKVNHSLDKVAVVDWDVHHGNGTQAFFYDRPDVLTISVHQENCFPPDSGWPNERGTGRGEGYNLNVPLLPGSGHDIYLYAMERIVVPALQTYQPDLIVIASGLDANGSDPMGRMLLGSESFRAMTQLMVDMAVELCDCRLVIVHEGRYSEARVPFCGLAVVEALAGERTEVEDPFGTSKVNERFNAFQIQILDELAQEFGLVQQGHPKP